MHISISVFTPEVTVKRPFSPWGEQLGKHLGVNKTTSDNMLMVSIHYYPPSTSSALLKTPQISNNFIRVHNGVAPPPLPYQLINISSAAACFPPRNRPVNDVSLFTCQSSEIAKRWCSSKRCKIKLCCSDRCLMSQRCPQKDELLQKAVQFSLFQVVALQPQTARFQSINSQMKKLGGTDLQWSLPLIVLDNGLDLLTLQIFTLLPVA